MTLTDVANSFPLLHLSNDLAACIEQTNDTFTLKVGKIDKETAGEYGTRLNNIAKRLRMQYTIVRTQVNYLAHSGEIEFF